MAPRGHGPLTAERRATLIKQRARELGFDRTGITDLRPTPHAETLARWLASGFAGRMHYMHRQATKRRNPAAILPGASWAIVVTRNYYQSEPPDKPGTGRVAKYARGRDYHQALREPLALLADHVRSLGDAHTIAKPYVDAGPVPERELAQRAGIGWIGKNTMLIDPRHGSYCLLGTILTNLEIAPDVPFQADRCGSCRRCLDACPTNAFAAERLLDSRRCISYLTIEYRGETIPNEIATQMGDWIFGCDVCQDVCPWNEKFAAYADDPVLDLDADFAHLDLAELESIEQDEFDRRYGWTPLERPGVSGMKRNARVARANQRGVLGCPTSQTP